MNKKGFTLVEIIICIALISIIGVSSTIIVIKTKNKNNNVNILNGTKMSAKLSNITNKILQAANVYIAVEKDGNGNTYETGIKNGGKGLYIKVQTLVDSGYLDKSLLDNLQKETNKLTSELQLLAVDAVNNNDDELCNNSNAIEYTVSWSNDNDKPIYLCPYDNVKEKINLKDKILKDTKNMLVENIDFKETPNEPMVGKIEDNYGISYYYRGNVENNYINFAGMCWRIVRILGNGNVKIILEDKTTICENSKIEKTETKSFIEDTTSAYGTNSSANVIYSYSLGYEKLNSWFEEKFKNKSVQLLDGVLLSYSNFVATSKFCAEKVYYRTNGSLIRYSLSWKRKQEQIAYLKCDKTEPNIDFTDNEAQLIDLNIGLLTIDETQIAGYSGWSEGLHPTYDKYSITKSYLYNSDNSWWTMSRSYSGRTNVYNSTGFDNICYIKNDEKYKTISSQWDTNKAFYRPVMVIFGDLIATGNGNKNTPYKLIFDVSVNLE